MEYFLSVYNLKHNLLKLYHNASIMTVDTMQPLCGGIILGLQVFINTSCRKNDITLAKPFATSEQIRNNKSKHQYEKRSLGTTGGCLLRPSTCPFTSFEPSRLSVSAFSSALIILALSRTLPKLLMMLSGILGSDPK